MSSDAIWAARIWQVYALLICGICFVYLMINGHEIWSDTVRTQFVSEQEHLANCESFQAPMRATATKADIMIEREQMHIEHCKSQFHRNQYQYRQDLFTHIPLLIVVLFFFVLHVRLAKRVS